LGKPSSVSFVQQFSTRRDTSCQLLYENGLEIMGIEEPTQLANFVAFCKARGRRIYLRGHNSSHSQLLPTLFRGRSDHQALWTAYNAFIRDLSITVKGTRFTRRNFGAVLQHYGFRTPWLDVVDDLHVAIWFALNKCDRLDDGSITYRRAVGKHGWITLIAAPRGVCVQDLRETQSSRNTRCHVQQGFSIAMQHDGVEGHVSNQDFARCAVARVRIPNAERWCLTGFRASQSYLFPIQAIDDTYAKLSSPDVTSLAAKAEAASGLVDGALGRAAVYSEPPSMPASERR
jgi:hypothetical protein